MTREEFVRNNSWVLKGIRERCELTQAETDYLNYLIEVLEQESCEDCISRTDVLNRINLNYNNHQRIDAQSIKDIIITTPTIKALEQEPILDKIRAEIEQNAYPIVHGVNNREKGMTLYGILQIIDKYKTESEEKE